MIYREAQEVTVRFGKTSHTERRLLTPVPRANGHWMLCHPCAAVRCATCGSEPGVPCVSVRGHTVLTTAQAETALALAQGAHVSPSRRQALRDALQGAKSYRCEAHAERVTYWRELGMRCASGRKPGATAKENMRSLQALAKSVVEKLAELEKKL